MNTMLIQSLSARLTAPSYSFLPILAIVLFACYIVAVILLHVLERNTNPIRYSLSHYASTPHGRMAKIQLILRAVGYISLGVYLYLNYSFLQAGGLLLVAAAAAGLLGAIFSIDENHHPFQASDYLHIAFAAVHFFLLVTAMSTITTNLAFEGLLSRGNLAQLMVTLAYDSLIVFAICFFIPPLRRVAGLMERIFMASTLAWFFLITIQFL
jgi:hypothetical protein